MPKPFARPLSLVFLVLSVVAAWPKRGDILSALIVEGAALLLIWFPAEIDDYTFGMTRRGSRIDVHTPPFLIAGAGWLLLILVTVVLFRQSPLARMLGT